MFSATLRRDVARTFARPSAALFAVGIFAGSFVASAPAHAALGDGISVGAGRLKLGVDLNLRYDTAAAAGVGEGTNPSTAELIALGLAKFAYALKTDSVFADVGGNVGYNYYTGALNAKDTGLSFVSALLKGEVDINKDRPFGAEITEYFSRTDATNNPVFGLGVLALSDQTRLRLHLKPGGGAIEFGLSGEFGAGTYSAILPSSGASCTAIASADGDPSCTGAFDSWNYKIQLDGQWRIFPKTGLIFELSYGGYQYTINSSQSTAIGSVPASPIIGNVGFGTLLTTRLSFSIKAGYEGMLFSQATPAVPMLNTFDGQVELGYKFTDNIFGRIGYSHLATPVAGVFHYYGDHHVYLEGQLRATSFLQFNLLGTFDQIEFGNTPDPREDLGYGVIFNGDLTTVAWLHVIAGLTYSGRSSNVVVGSNYTRTIVNVGVASFF